MIESNLKKKRKFERFMRELEKVRRKNDNRFRRKLEA